jgi:hypothetical protein
MSSENNQSRFYRSVFRRCMSAYDEFRSVQGTNSCSAFYCNLGQTMGGAKNNSRVIPTIPSDFICEVEIKAKRALNGAEYAYFKAVYLDKQSGYEVAAQDYLGEEKFTLLKHTVQEKVGKMLAATRVYPVEKYMRPVDMR